jgi:hypothetical protein
MGNFRATASILAVQELRTGCRVPEFQSSRVPEFQSCRVAEFQRVPRFRVGTL